MFIMFVNVGGSKEGRYANIHFLFIWIIPQELLLQKCNHDGVINCGDYAVVTTDNWKSSSASRVMNKF